MTFASRAIDYYFQLNEPDHLPPGVSVLNPYRQPAVQDVVRRFFTRFFDDTRPRVFILGINPGRFGAGITGVSFTSAQNLATYCGIDNDLPKRLEVSSRFVYQVVEAFGGAAEFYGHFFITSLYPLALVREGKNYNFYDDRATTTALWPAIAETVRTQLTFGGRRDVAVCLGRKNETYLRRLNEQHGFFDRILTLDHPRYILQYRNRDVDAYREAYIRTLADCLA
ncbi:uracil-DNA glycosylase family protein [Tellurirhabdus rosea]|uniref:uracil-DNA glycosylase family protein n=1 Tax=Tellurirhabdus rosea TaxID=2674997 RepID=UPI002255CA6F|nr:uracil-DNA glycosylase family protein [Tellurirhabdus rosea]